MEKILEFFENDRFAAHNNIEVVDIAPGKATTRMEVNDIHLNGVGTVHGGALFTMADFTFALAANSHGTVTVAINANISYLKAVKNGVLTAEARELSSGGRIASYTVDIYDESRDLVAVFQGMAYRKRENISDLMNDL
ncbi:PaaI family thioesterase [Methanobacterium petrolearium]|uniref:PaaI family thioesterase n=1 Tax=Methanobacterium petrolearium TaxID=710190 RepID=UPI001AE6EFBB|nr:PaaI family thioesterase [Methanobacterium petrolearium]MBP1945188.1 acyl-CoA thioesterase [Methanobacterium petrolearium]BDZ71117.1 phenylacetic acid degradation protein [Methanobacterium petrolearium]